MNRRTFITSSLITMTLTSRSWNVFAQDAPSDVRWDETSKLFGNGWNYLGEANDGEIAITNIGIRGSQSDLGLTPVYAVVHNNTDEAVLLDGIDSSDPEKSVGTSQVVQTVIGPRSYALAGFMIAADLATRNDLPELTINTKTVANTKSSYGFVDESIPLQPLAIRLDADVAWITIKNTSDHDTSAWTGSGLVLWLNEGGEITMGDSFSIDESIPAGHEYQQDVPMSDVPDPEDRFLVGVFAKD